MSARKEKLAIELKNTFKSIMDILIRIKPNLIDTRKNARPALSEDLYRVAALAETFTQLRSKTVQDLSHLSDLTDALDREGVNIWNAAGFIRPGPDDDGRPVIAALRLAGFRLVQAGLEHKPAVEALIHVLQLASKAGACLSEIGSKDVAASVLGCAAKFEELMRSAEDAQEAHRKPKLEALMLYYSSRMEAAWREGNDGVADFMLQKITENDQFSLLVPRDRQVLAAKLLEIGKSLLKESREEDTTAITGARSRNAVKWVQRAFSMIEQVDDTGCPGMTELRRSVLRTLARVYYLSSSHDPENITRAETALQELMATSSTESSEYQPLRWMRLAILKRQNAGQSVLLEAFQSIINHMALAEIDIADIQRELRSFTQEHELVSSVLLHCIERCVHTEGDAGLQSVDRLLLSLIFHCSKDSDHSRAIGDLGKAFTSVQAANCELSQVSITACLTLLWQFGDQHYNGKKWNTAVDWFLCGTHQLFRNLPQGTMKCYRKAALCYIQLKEYASASSLVRHCSGNEAATHYMILLIAVKQGLESEAISAVRDMIQSADFDRKMLLLATRMAYESDMKTLLLTALEALVQTLKRGENLEGNLEAITLIRCIIRLLCSLLDDPVSDQGVFITSLIQHFQTAKTLVDVLSTTKDIAVATQDISWLWRTAYNTAVKGCSAWEGAEEHVSNLFDVCRELLEAYRRAALVPNDVEVCRHIAIASFAAVAGRVFIMRQQVSSASLERGILRDLAQDVEAAKNRIWSMLSDNKILLEQDGALFRSYIHTLRVFEVELFCGLKEWKHVLQILQVHGLMFLVQVMFCHLFMLCFQGLAKVDSLAVDTFESIADILWVEPDCPVDVMFAALEAILHASLDHRALSIDKFSRWLRAICTILLCRDAASDRAKAAGFMEQAISVLEEHGNKNDVEEVYPIDERQWLVSSAYNTGIECLQFVLNAPQFIF